MISVCVCSWNDLPFLKLLYKSLKRNTKIPYELIIHDNGSEDGTYEWLIQNNIKCSRSETNEGVAAVNYSVNQAKYSYITDANSDMYFLPGWDTEILKQIKKFESKNVKKFTISSCLIEPAGGNPEYSMAYFGHNPESFMEEALLRDFLERSSTYYAKPDTTQYSHPITMPKALWDEFGGVDTRYQYGIATDHDIPASAYKAGCRDFIMLGKSRVYHFISQTVRKLPVNRSDGQKTFLEKWGISVDEFRKRLGVALPFKKASDNLF